MQSVANSGFRLRLPSQSTVVGEVSPAILQNISDSPRLDGGITYTGRLSSHTNIDKVCATVFNYDVDQRRGNDVQLKQALGKSLLGRRWLCLVSPRKALRLN